MAGLIFKKTVVWHLVNALLGVAGFLGGLALIVGIGLVTFTIYIVTGSAHLLSITSMAILACTLVLLARDELASTLDEVIWNNLKTYALRSCVRGGFTCQSGWLVADTDASTYTFFKRFLSRIHARKYPIRVLKVIAEDGECFVISWELRPMPMSTDSAITLPSRQKVHFTQYLLS